VTPAVDDGGAGRQRASGKSAVARIRRDIEYCLAPVRLRRTVAIAFAVGTILTLLNQGDVIVGGFATGATAVKAGLNYLVPFVVSNLGMLSGREGPDQ
jgi:hypothetical protein